MHGANFIRGSLRLPRWISSISREITDHILITGKRSTMVFNDLARRFAAMMVLRLPRGYDLLTPQWRYILLYRMHRPHEA